MYVFESMSHVSIFTAITIFVFLFAVLRQNPLITAGIFIQQVFTSPKYLLHLIAVIGILYLNKIELIAEGSLNIHNDFTPFIYRIEGNLVSWIQNTFENDMLTWALTYFYVVIFPALMITSIGIYTSQKNYKIFCIFCYAIMINYLVATPFYLFLEVNEVWSFQPAHVQSLMPMVFPTFEQAYRPMSGINNCLPSLHTSISVTVALIAFKSQNKLWGWMASIIAAIIIFSIFYLGIHWFIDMIAGLLLGVFSFKMAFLLGEREILNIPNPKSSILK